MSLWGGMIKTGWIERYTTIEVLKKLKRGNKTNTFSKGNCWGKQCLYKKKNDNDNWKL